MKGKATVAPVANGPRAGSLPAKPIVPLLAWQQQWIEDDHRFKLVVGASQSAGKSFTTSLDMALDRLKPGAASADLGILLSASERQSVELMEKVRMHTRAWDVQFEDGFFGGTSTSEHRTIFPNKKRLIALPANPDTARGYSGDMLFDEFALHRDSQAIWAAGMTRVSRGYKCRVASTIKGLNNKFGELAKMLGLADGVAPQMQPVDRQGWHGYWVSAEMAVAQGAPVDLAAMREALMDDDIYAQDFCNIPMDDASQYIPLAHILACESAEASLDWNPALKSSPARERGVSLSAGYDVARHRDGSVIFLGYETGPVLVICGLIVLSRMKFAEQKKVCIDVAEAVKASGGRFSVDATGIGMQLGEELSDAYPGVVEAVQMGASVETELKDEDQRPVKVPVKERLAALVKSRVEERRILLPESPQLRREFQAVRRYIGATGKPRLDSARTNQGHADWFWACALLCGAVEGPRRSHQPVSKWGAVGGETVLGGVREWVF